MSRLFSNKLSLSVILPESPMKKSIILMNLGTPAAAEKKAVRQFLKEFLSDTRVVEVPRLVWWFVLNFIILNFRTPKVTEAYQKIWWEKGSPLRLITIAQKEKLQKRLESIYEASDCPIVEYAMTYSGPSIKAVIERLQGEGVDHFTVLPLYPQFSATTTGSIYDQLGQYMAGVRNIPQVHVIKQYFDHPLYIQALDKSVRDQWKKTGRPECLLMSFHSIPQDYVDDGDPYYDQCMRTAELLADSLQLKANEWSVSFQSRIGFAKWLSPYTIDVLKKSAVEGIKHIDVICPAFSADCLETLEEIQFENRDVFIENGGEVFNLIPCLNDQPEHIEMMADLVKAYLPKL